MHSLNQTDNVSKLTNIGIKPTSNGNGVNNSMKLNNNSNGSINETNGKPLNIDEVSFGYFFYFLQLFACEFGWKYLLWMARCQCIRCFEIDYTTSVSWSIQNSKRLSYQFSILFSAWIDPLELWLVRAIINKNKSTRVLLALNLISIPVFTNVKIVVALR